MPERLATVTQKLHRTVGSNKIPQRTPEEHHNYRSRVLFGMVVISIGLAIVFILLPGNK